jgi:hypothetical protein
MTALRKILIEEKPVVAETVTRATGAKLYVVTPDTRIEVPAEGHNTLKDIVLFFIAPFIGLAYVIALPFVGLAAIAVLAGRAVAKMEAVKMVGTALKPAGFVIAAPLVGLAYAVLFPFIGLVALTWIGGRAAVAAVAR